MKGFTPVKKRANEFKYKPRFYDPAKEERDERRAELRGTTSKSDAEGYTPGSYIKRQSEARDRNKNRNAGSFMTKIFIAAMVFLLAFLLLPRIIGAFNIGSTTPAKVEAVDEFEEFDPYAPINIVPNDYKAE